VVTRITSCRNVATLETWLDLAATGSAADLLKAVRTPSPPAS
jgi:hypothetical protein